MEIIATIVIGFVVGALAKILMPGRDPGGLLMTSLLGIAGSVVASFLGRSLGWYQANDAASFVSSVVGAMILLGLYRMSVGNRRRPIGF